MRFLIVKTSSLGDIVQALDALSYLSQKFPQAKIDWVAEKSYANLLMHHPSVDRVIAIETRSWKRFKRFKEIFSFRKKLRRCRYDAVFDLQGNCKSGMVVFSARSSNKIGFGKKSVREWPNLFFTHYRFNFVPDLNIRLKYLRLIQTYFKDVSEFLPKPFLYEISSAKDAFLEDLCARAKSQNKKMIMVCPGSKWKNKQLSLEAWEEILGKLVKDWDPFYFFMWGSAVEKKQAFYLQQLFLKRSVVVDKLDLHVWQRLMDKMDLVFAVDSSALHLCGTTTTPSVSVFGPTKSSIFKPLGNNHMAVQGTCPYEKHFVKQCPILRSCKTGACTQKLSGDEVYQQLSAWWQSLSKSI